MLEELTITNFAIIDRLTVRFDPGFNVLTGETGAGKSIIIDAVGAVLGGRVSAEMVRSGADLARVEGIFSLDDDNDPVLELLREHELLDDGEGAVILRREINVNGRSTARVNGRAVPVSVLGRIGALLVDIHGQSEHLSLFRVDEHLELLDRYAGITSQRAQLAALVEDLRRVRRERDGLLAAQADAARRLDLLRYQVEEIEKAGLRPDEEEELLAEKRLLANAERLALLATAASDELSGDEGRRGVLDTLGRASNGLADLVKLDESQQEMLEQLNSALYTLEEVARGLRSYADGIEADPGRLAEIEERLDLLQRLKRKYGATVAEVIEFGQDAARQQEELVNSEERLEQLDAEIELLKGRIGELAGELSLRRREAADRLSAAVEGELRDLNMARARFAVTMTRRPDPDGVPAMPGDDGQALPSFTGEEGETRYAFDERGIDRVEFLISPNPGEDLKPLARIASGGEASRLMLALKTILSTVDRTPTLIFDEVDTGVGGRGGQVVGEKLRLLGEAHQVLCITHLPQVAALGAEHLRVVKRIDGGRTHTDVEFLRGHARIEELAAMLGGMPPPPSAFKAAEELLARAHRVAAS
jgi:DNA repair protein RecN (Recombination protein N)